FAAFASVKVEVPADWGEVHGPVIGATQSAGPDVVNLVETSIMLDYPPGVIETGPAAVPACVVYSHESQVLDNGVIHGYTDFFTGDWVPGPYSVEELQNILDVLNLANSGEVLNPFLGLNGDNDCLDSLDRVAA